MDQEASRYHLAAPASTAEGWALERVTKPTRLYSANGIRTGTDGRIYVAQVAGSQVSAVDPDSGAIETISPSGGGITGPDDLVFDDEGNLYCTEITTGRVSVLRPDGTSDIIAGDVQVANPITFHQGHLIAGELRMGGRILELNRSGGIARVILDDVPMPNAFEVGPDGKLYFPAQGANEIWRVGLDGSNPEIVAKDLGVPDSVKFHPDGYIVSTQVGSGQVLKIDPRTGEKSVLANLDPGLDNVTFIGKRIFISHITGSIRELLPDGKVRSLVAGGFEWPMGIAVNASGTVHAADGMFSYTISPDGSLSLAGTLFDGMFPGFMRGIAASTDNEWVVTTATGTVARWTPGQPAETLAQGFEIAMGIAISGKAIVFADAGTGRVLSLEDGNVTELAGGLEKPYGVAVSEDGTVYVSQPDRGCVAKISGGKAHTVLDDLGWPEGIAIHAGKLYVIETGSKQVTELDLTTGSRRVLASNLPVGAPKGVAPLRLGGVGDMCGPMWSFTGIAASNNGTLFISADGEGSILALRPL